MRLPPELGWVALLWAVSRSLQSKPAVNPAPFPGPFPTQTTMTLAQLTVLAQQVGFPDPALAAAVAMAESSGNPLAVGDNGTSFGLWQIHAPAHPEYNTTSLGDPVYNAQAAYAISKGGTDWTPWSTFTSGAYRRYLPGANA